MRYAVLAVLAILAFPGFGRAGPDAVGPDAVGPDAVGPDMAASDVVILGEVHDNPRHHRVQSDLVALLRPGALVFEMLSADQAARITADNRLDQAALAAALDWDQSGWPDFALYYPIFAAAPGARVYGGALPREAARAALKAGVVAYFGADAGDYGLDRELAGAEQAARQAYQSEVHCGALPETMLPGMVGLQRLRDAFLARAVVAAMAGTGGPVVVITGNGHARKDWGLAVYLHRARPDLRIHALGQSEDGQIEGLFDEIRDAPAADRPDPCLAFAKQG